MLRLTLQYRTDWMKGFTNSYIASVGMDVQDVMATKDANEMAILVILGDIAEWINHSM